MRFWILGVAVTLGACAPPTQYATPGTPIPIDMEVVTAGAEKPDTASTSSCIVPSGVGAVPQCVLSSPTIEETAAFAAEATRLELHPDAKCRLLGAAISARLPSVMMFDRAIVRKTGLERDYGVGFSYPADNDWIVRIARRFNQLTERSVSDKLRTLRHEVSHSLGAPEESTGSGWTASEYAERCG